MKNKSVAQNQNQKAGVATQPITEGELNQNKIDLPAPQEVAGRAYNNYLNQGSRHGHDLEHWLNAEAELLEERKLTRTHGYPHQN